MVKKEKQANNTLKWSSTEIADLFGVGTREIRRLTEIGIIKAEGLERSRKYDAKEVTKTYIAYLRDQPKQKKTANEELENKKIRAEISIKEVKAKTAELELQELEGSMHRAEDVEAVFNDLVFTIRSAFMAMPGRLAVDTAELTTPAETSARIQEEVNEVLSTLSQYKYDPEEYRRKVRERKGWLMNEDEELED